MANGSICPAAGPCKAVWIEAAAPPGSGTDVTRSSHNRPSAAVSSNASAWSASKGRRLTPCPLRVIGEGDWRNPCVIYAASWYWLQVVGRSRSAYQRRWPARVRSEEHTSELQSLMRISYAVFCLKKKTKTETDTETLKLKH